MWNWMMLGLESNRVIGLRIAKLMRGGKAAQREARRMVSENACGGQGRYKPDGWCLRRQNR